MKDLPLKKDVDLTLLLAQDLLFLLRGFSPDLQSCTSLVQDNFYNIWPYLSLNLAIDMLRELQKRCSVSWLNWPLC